jgi:hypothetical protein
VIRSFALVSCVMFLLAGCTTVTHGSPSAAPTTHSVVGIPAGEVGSAPLTTADGRLLGTVVFTNSAQGIAISLPDLSSILVTYSSTLALADSPFSPSTCGSNNVWEIGFDLSDPHRPDLQPGMYAGGDPSFYTTVLIAQGIEPPDSNGCSQHIAATGPITWTIPLQRPWVHPTDSGAASGARGMVASKHGAPNVYTTAPGDTWTAIAGRFGISGSDLDWLNPNRLGGSAEGEAYAQQLLNLDPTDRGNSESRRPH